MLLLLDECLPKQLKRELVGHGSVTVPEAGLAGVKNGALLARATQSFDVFITVDTNLRFQQTFPGWRSELLFCERSATICPTNGAVEGVEWTLSCGELY